MMDYSQFVTEIELPEISEISKTISVYRYRANKPYNPTELNRQIERHHIGKSEFGIINEAPQDGPRLQPSTRTYWVRLGTRTRQFVDNNGNLQFIQFNRLIVASAVLELFEDNGDTGIILFGGGSGIQSELENILRSDFDFRDIRRQSLRPEQIRNILMKGYFSKINKIRIDPSEDIDWGNTRDAKLTSTSNRYFNTDSTMMSEIRKNDKILILGFQSYLDEVYRQGMTRSVQVSFELKPTSVRISAPSFNVAESARAHAQQIFFSLASLWCKRAPVW